MSARGCATFAIGVVLGACLAGWRDAPEAVANRPIVHAAPPLSRATDAPHLEDSAAARGRSRGGTRMYKGARAWKRRRQPPPPLLAPSPSARVAPAGRGTARTHGPFYGDLEAAGGFDRAVRTVSRRGELVLLHGDANRLRMLVNLVANLNQHDIYHVLLLGFSNETCARLRVRGQIGCAHSSYLYESDEAEGALSGRRGVWNLQHKYVAWIQKFHYMRRLVEARINVLALDSDVVVTTDPYPHLHGAFGQYAFVTAFDTKGGFANVNVGIVYLQNASVGGPVHGLFVEFDRRVEQALRMEPPTERKLRNQYVTRFFWDQNLFNKVLLSALSGHAVYLPDESDASWTKAHADELWRSARPEAYNGPTKPVRAPPSLLQATPWYPPEADFRWKVLPPAPGSGAKPERVLLAPPWLISADNALGHRYKHWLYGARPAPCVMLHFVCVAAGEGSRLLPMNLFGYWDAAAVDAELNALHAALGGLALATGRTPVQSALNCSGVRDRFLEPGKLPSRCFWHVHTPNGVACVFRVGKCADRPNLLASPTEWSTALRARSAAGLSPPPVVSLSFRSGGRLNASSSIRAAVDSLLGEHAAAPLVLVKLRLPTIAEAEAGGLKLLGRTHELATAAHEGLGAMMSRFRARCPELTDRSKRRKRECTNVC